MTSRHLCQKLNEYIASISDEIVFTFLSSESSLYPLFEMKVNSKVL